MGIHKQEKKKQPTNNHKKSIHPNNKTTLHSKTKLKNSKNKIDNKQVSYKLNKKKEVAEEHDVIENI